MLIEFFLQNDEHKSNLTQALSLLHRANFFGVMLEVAAVRSQIQSSHNLIESSAIRHAWHNGYVEALRDLFSFPEQHFITPTPHELTPVFNAPNILLERGDINEDEYRKLTGKSPIKSTGSSIKTG